MDWIEWEDTEEETIDINEQFKNEVKTIKRDGIDKLLEWLEESDFYKAPASTRHHLAWEGGLVEHSMNVLVTARKFNQALDDPVDDESLTLVSLFHDLGKHQYYKKDFYKPKYLKSGELAKTPYERNKNLISVPHEISSVHILSKYIELTEDETWAILQHNGMYSDLKYQLQGKETQLQSIVHWADMWASRFIEQ